MKPALNRTRLTRAVLLCGAAARVWLLERGYGRADIVKKHANRRYGSFGSMPATQHR